MKPIPIVVLIFSQLMSARIGHAQDQVFSGEPGVPGTPISPIPGDTLNFLEEYAGIGAQTLVEGGDGELFTYTDEGFGQVPAGTPFTVVPGDVVFLNDPTGGDAPANWAAVVNFFNPTDPDGLLGLPATEDQAFFPSNVGPGGFAALQLFPNTVYLTQALNELSTGGPIVQTFVDHGPAGGFPAGEYLYTTLQAAASPVPEPTSLSLLTIASVSLLARRRRAQPKA